jgi:hypothetical protein
VREGRQRLLEAGLAHVAPRTGDVAPDFDAHGLGLLQVVRVTEPTSARYMNLQGPGLIPRSG